MIGVSTMSFCQCWVRVCRQQENSIKPRSLAAAAAAAAAECLLLASAFSWFMCMSADRWGRELWVTEGWSLGGASSSGRSSGSSGGRSGGGGGGIVRDGWAGSRVGVFSCVNV